MSYEDERMGTATYICELVSAKVIESLLVVIVGSTFVLKGDRIQINKKCVYHYHKRCSDKHGIARKLSANRYFPLALTEKTKLDFLFKLLSIIDV